MFNEAESIGRVERPSSKVSFNVQEGWDPDLIAWSEDGRIGYKGSMEIDSKKYTFSFSLGDLPLDISTTLNERVKKGEDPKVVVRDLVVIEVKDENDQLVDLSTPEAYTFMLSMVFPTIEDLFKESIYRDRSPKVKVEPSLDDLAFMAGGQTVFQGISRKMSVEPGKIPEAFKH